MHPILDMLEIAPLVCDWDKTTDYSCAFVGVVLISDSLRDDCYMSSNFNRASIAAAIADLSCKQTLRLASLLPCPPNVKSQLVFVTLIFHKSLTIHKSLTLSTQCKSQDIDLHNGQENQCEGSILREGQVGFNQRESWNECHQPGPCLVVERSHAHLNPESIFSLFLLRRFRRFSSAFNPSSLEIFHCKSLKRSDHFFSSSCTSKCHFFFPIELRRILYFS
jgi:hypothetical protein